MIAGNHEYGDFSLLELDHSRAEVEAGVVVLPVPIVDVSGDDHKIDGLVDGQADEAIEGPAAGPSERFGRGFRSGRQSAQGAIEVEVGGVEEAKHG